MPDTPVEPLPGGRYPADMESRVAVLEQIARSTSASLERLERRFDMVDRRIDGTVSDHRSDFRWLLGIMLGGFGAMLGVMAHGFHWL